MPAIYGLLLDALGFWFMASVAATVVVMAVTMLLTRKAPRQDR